MNGMHKDEEKRETTTTTTTTNMAVFRFTFTTHEHGQIFFIFRTMVFG